MRSIGGVTRIYVLIATCWTVLIMGLKMFTRSSDVTSYDLSEIFFLKNHLSEYSAVPMIMTFRLHSTRTWCSRALLHIRNSEWMRPTITTYQLISCFQIQILGTWLFIRHLPLYGCSIHQVKYIVTGWQHIIQKQNTNLRKKILLCCFDKHHVRRTHTSI